MFLFIFIFLKVGPTCLIFFNSWSFWLRNNLFRSGFNFIYPTWIFFTYLLFFEIFLKSLCQVSHYTRRLEIRKIFRLYQNLTKFDRVARFHETNLTAQSVSLSEIYRILYYSLNHYNTITKRQNYRFAIFHQNFIFFK